MPGQLCSRSSRVRSSVVGTGPFLLASVDHPALCIVIRGYLARLFARFIQLSKQSARPPLDGLSSLSNDGVITGRHTEHFGGCRLGFRRGRLRKHLNAA